MSKKIIIIILVISVFLLSGCSLFGENEDAVNQDLERPSDNDDFKDNLPLIDIENENVVKIYENEYWFMEEFGDDILRIHPELTFDFVPTIDWDENYEHTLAHLMVTEGIDLVSLHYPTYRNYVLENRLYEIDHFVMESQFQIHDYSTGMLQFLRSVDGNLYGLSPSFTSSAIYYNKTLFDLYEVDYPHDHMTWDDLIELSSRFPLAEGLYGIDLLDAYDLVTTFARLADLDVVDESGSVNIDSQEWKAMWNQVMELYDNKIINENTTHDAHYRRTYRNFLQGQAAMVVARNHFLGELEDANVDFEWALAPEPIHPDAPNDSLSFMNSSIFSIPAQAANPEGAWKVLQYIHSSDYARKLLDHDPYQLVSRYSVVNEYQEEKLTVFYERVPSFNRSIYSYIINYPEEYSLFYRSIIQEGRSIINRSINLDEALEKIKKEMEKELFEW